MMCYCDIDDCVFEEQPSNCRHIVNGERYCDAAKWDEDGYWDEVEP